MYQPKYPYQLDVIDRNNIADDDILLLWDTSEQKLKQLGTSILHSHPYAMSKILIPNLSDYSWLNQQTTTAIQTSEGIIISKRPKASGNSFLIKPLSGLSQIDILFSWLYSGCAIYRVCATFYDQVSGKLHMIYLMFTTFLLYSAKWNSPTSFNSDYLNRSYPYLFYSHFWLRLSIDSTTRYIYFSKDSVLWSLLDSRPKNDFCSPTHYGFGILQEDGNPAHCADILIHSVKES